MDETVGDASSTADVTDNATIQTGSEDENRYIFGYIDPKIDDKCMKKTEKILNAPLAFSLGI